MNLNNENKLKAQICENCRLDLSRDFIINCLNNIECDLINDLGFDSFSMVELIVALEDCFNVEFELSELDLSILRKFNNLLNYVNRYVVEELG